MRKSEVLAAEAVSCLNRAMASLRDIWEEIGIPEEQRLERTEVVRKHIKGLLDMMVAEEESLKERLLKSIALCRKELNVLCEELQLDPVEVEEGSTILQMEKNLRTHVEVLLKQKRDRKQELKTLQERDGYLCDILCTTPFSIDSNAVPSLEDLDRYRRHVASLTSEKEQRQEEFLSSKRQIILLMEELDHTPDTSFERDVVCEDENAFCLSLDNIAALQSLLRQLEAQQSLNEAVCMELRSRIRVLWERLQVPAEEREASAVHLPGSRAKTRKALQSEVDHLEELKLQNVKSVVQATRAELADYWDKCFYSQEQREAFSPYYDEDYTETLLNLHDAEVGKVKSYYEAHKDLFEAIQKWEENWKLFLELERKATDPSRFTNRGGNLLKEEKQRAKLQKVLSKLQEELQRRVQDWEQEHDGAFLVKGQRFMDYVTEQWHLYHLGKEMEKQERQLKKSRQIETEMMYGSTPRTSIKRQALSPTTPGKLRKVKQCRLARQDGHHALSEYLLSSRAGVGGLGGTASQTGLALQVLLAAMLAFSSPCVRRSGHFEVFYWTHLSYISVWILLILHGPHFWKWFVVPGCLFMLEKVLGMAWRRAGGLRIVEVNLLPSKVTHLVIERPQSFHYKPGDYVYLNIPAIATYEWHPFTISSAPEQQETLWLHIRSLGQWTNKLYEYFQQLGSPSPELKPLSKSLRERRCRRWAQEGLCSRSSSDGVSVATGGDRAVQLTSYKATGAVAPGEEDPPMGKVSTGLGETHRICSIKCYIDGPYGTPTRRIFTSEHAVLIGAGIGITPFASILQSIMYRYRQRKQSCPSCHHSWCEDLRDKEMMLRKVDFIWINRDQKNFEWFVSLLTKLEMEQAEQELGGRFLEMHMYMTSALSKNDMKAIGLQMALDLLAAKEQKDLITGLRTRTQPGRPDWSKVFQKVAEEKRGKVQVFFCGSPALAKVIRVHCERFGFPFFKENF